MSKKGIPKARRLTDDERRTVAEYAINNSEESDRSVAIHFGCTPAQVRYAVERAEAGVIAVRRTRLTDEGRTAVAMASKTVEQMFEEELHRSVAQIASDAEMPADKRVQLLGSLARMKRTLQETAIEGHIRTGDATFLARLVRRFLPASTDDDVILILREELEKWRADSA